MFRPNPAIIRFTSKEYQRFVTTMRLCKDGEISSSRLKYVIIKNLIIEDENITTCFGLTYLNLDDEISPSLHNRIVVTNL